MFEREYGEKKDVKVIGRWFLKHYDDEMNLKQTIEGKNVITETGLDFLASFLNSAATAASTFTMRYIAIGTDATTEQASNTALGTELSRHTGTVSFASAKYTVVATFAAGEGTGAIAEYGLFSSNTAGTMFSRDTEAVINKAAGDTLEVTTEVTLA